MTIHDVTLSASDIESMASAIRAQFIADNGDNEEGVETQEQIALSIASAAEEFVQDLVDHPLEVSDPRVGYQGPLSTFRHWLDYHSGAQLRRIRMRAQRAKEISRAS